MVLHRDDNLDEGVLLGAEVQQGGGIFVQGCVLGGWGDVDLEGSRHGVGVSEERLDDLGATHPRSHIMGGGHSLLEGLGNLGALNLIAAPLDVAQLKLQVGLVTSVDVQLSAIHLLGNGVEGAVV